MSIKIQKIIRFIPLANVLFTGISWVLFYRRNEVPNKMKRIIGTLLSAAVACLILMILEVILDSLFDYPSLETIVNLLVSFADMYIFSSVLIYDQEKYYSNNQHQ